MQPSPHPAPAPLVFSSPVCEGAPIGGSLLHPSSRKGQSARFSIQKKFSPLSQIKTFILIFSLLKQMSTYHRADFKGVFLGTIRSMSKGSKHTKIITNEHGV